MKVLLKNIFSLGIARIAGGVILFFVYRWLATHLGPSDFGRFSLVTAYFLIFSSVLDLGMSWYVVKEASGRRSLEQTYLSHFLLLELFIACILFIVFLAVPWIMSYDAEVRAGMYVTGAGLFILSASLPFYSIVAARQQLHLAATVYLVNTLITAVWYGFAAAMSWDLTFFFVNYPLIGVIDIAIYACFTWPLARISFNIERSLLKRIFLGSLPFGLALALELTISKVDVVIQEIYLPYSEVGLYSAAYRLLDFLAFFPVIVVVSLFTFIAEQKETITPELNSALDRVSRFTIVLALPLAGGVGILAETIIMSIYDARYLAAAAPLRVLIWALACIFVYIPPCALVLAKRTRYAVGLLVAVAAFNIAGNLLLVPLYGIMASAWLTAASYFLVGAGHFFLARNLAAFSVLRHATWPAIATGIMCILITLLKTMNLLVLIGIAVVFYFGILVLAGFLRKEDVRTIFSILSRKREGSA